MSGSTKTWYTSKVADCPVCGRKDLAISKAGILRPHLTAASMGIVNAVAVTGISNAVIVTTTGMTGFGEWCNMSLTPIVDVKPPTEVE